MTKIIVKRSPYKVGQVLNQTKMKEIIKGRTVPSCGGYKVTSVAKLGHTHGGYFINLTGRRYISGKKVYANFIVTFPLLGRKTRRAYHSAFRYFIGDPDEVVQQPNKNVDKGSPKTVKLEDKKHMAKTSVAGTRKRMMLIDFLEE